MYCHWYLSDELSCFCFQPVFILLWSTFQILMSLSLYVIPSGQLCVGFKRLFLLNRVTSLVLALFHLMKVRALNCAGYKCLLYLYHVYLCFEQSLLLCCFYAKYIGVATHGIIYSLLYTCVLLTILSSIHQILILFRKWQPGHCYDIAWSRIDDLILCCSIARFLDNTNHL